MALLRCRTSLCCIVALLLYPRKRGLGMYRNPPVCLFVCSSVCLSRVNVTLAITFEPKEIRLITYVGSLWQDLSVCTNNFKIVTLILTFDLLLQELNLGYNFWTKRDKAFILQACILCEKTFVSVPIFFYLVTLTLNFDLLLKKITLAITFEPNEIRLSYYRCVFLVVRPFCLYQNVLPCDIDLVIWPSFEKKNS